MKVHLFLISAVCFFMLLSRITLANDLDSHFNCQNLTLYDFTTNFTDWDPNNLYQFGQSNNSIDGDGKSVFAKLEILNTNNQYIRSGIFTEFNSQVQDWSQYSSLQFGLKFQNVSQDMTADNRAPARANEDRQIFVELVESSGERFAYRIDYLDNNWNIHSIKFDDFWKRGGTNPGDGILDISSIQKLSYHVHSQITESFTEIYRVDAISLICNQVMSGTPLLSDIAQVFNIPAGAPKYSDVCVTSRGWRTENHPKYPIKTEYAVENFHPTRMDWTLVRDTTYIDSVIVKYGLTFSGVLNSKLSDFVDVYVNNNGRCENRDGKLIEWPWLDTDTNYDQFIGSANEPAYKQIYLDHAKLIYGSEAVNHLVSIQMDEPGFSIRLTEPRYDGCFGPGDLAKAVELGYPNILTDNDQNLAFQKEALGLFYAEMHDSIRTQSTIQNLGFSYNNIGHDFTDYRSSESFDFAMGELHLDSTYVKSLYSISQEAKSKGKIQVFSPTRILKDGPRDYDTNSDLYMYQTSIPQRDTIRKAIATAYASGSIHFVPWDTWFYGQTRHFGEPEEYADLFAMIRAVPQYFDYYEDAAYDISNLEDPRYSVKPISGNDPEISLLSRAIPGDSLAPIVVHVVNWGNNTSLDIDIINSYISPNQSFTASLVTPVPYVESEHVMAHQSSEVLRAGGLRSNLQSQAYQHLINTQSLDVAVLDQHRSRLSLSGIGVWSLLILSPLDCPLQIVEMANDVINSDVNAHQQIITNGIVPTGNSVRYTAGQNIQLVEDFEVITPSQFEALIVDCVTEN